MGEKRKLHLKICYLCKVISLQLIKINEKKSVICSLILEISPGCWRDWCWSWNSNTLATWCEELTHWKRAWCWERLKAGGEGDDRGWDGWMASLTRWTWIWVDSGVDDGQGGLVCCSSWGHKESDTTKQLNWTETLILVSILEFLKHLLYIIFMESFHKYNC